MDASGIRAGHCEPAGLDLHHHARHQPPQSDENALREAEEHYHGLFTACRDAIMVTDREDRVTDVNEPAFIETFGYTREEIAGKTVRDLYVDGERCIRFHDFRKIRGLC